MLHIKISLSSEREGCDSRLMAQESLVVTVERYTIRPRGVVVDQAEVELAPSCRLCGISQVIQALWDWTGGVSCVGIARYFGERLRIND